MKRFILTLSFAAFLSAGLVSCNDDAAEVKPRSHEMSQTSTGGDNPGPITKP